MDVKLDKWHKCKVDIEVLKELSKKSDIKGFQHVSLFFGLLIVTGSFSIFNLGNLVVRCFGFWCMATSIHFQIHCGMRRVIKLPFNQNY
jgi:hypothetical protein